jgi:hypothetical protein
MRHLPLLSATLLTACPGPEAKAAPPIPPSSATNTASPVETVGYYRYRPRLAALRLLPAPTAITAPIATGAMAIGLIGATAGVTNNQLSERLRIGG